MFLAVLQVFLDDYQVQKQQEIANDDILPTSTGFLNQIVDNSSNIFEREREKMQKRHF